MGQTGMPDTIRITVEGTGARPLRKARSRASTMHEDGYETPFRAALQRTPHDRDRHLLLSSYGTASADDAGGTPDPSTLEAYVWAVGQLDRHEFAALALTLGISASPWSPRSCWCAPATASPT